MFKFLKKGARAYSSVFWFLVAAHDWKMKLAGFMLLLINSAASINLKYISKRNSGMSGVFLHFQRGFRARACAGECEASSQCCIFGGQASPAVGFRLVMGM